MKPHCVRCGEVNPSPMRDDDGDLIYWFRVEEDNDGETRLCSGSEDQDEEGESTVAFTGMTVKDFEYDGSYGLVCPECASEECEYLHGEIVDDGLDDEGWMQEGFDPFDDAVADAADTDDPED